MYEQNEVPVFRRILWLALWFIVIVAVVWLLVWFIFFRNTSPKTTSTHHGSSTSQSSAPQKSSKSDSTSSSNSAQNTGSNAAANTGSTPGASAPTATQPTELANTGAGDLVWPFAVASLVGSTIYYVRATKRLNS